MAKEGLGSSTGWQALAVFLSALVLARAAASSGVGRPDQAPSPTRTVVAGRGEAPSDA